MMRLTILLLLVLITAGCEAQDTDRQGAPAQSQETVLDEPDEEVLSNNADEALEVLTQRYYNAAIERDVTLRSLSGLPIKNLGKLGYDQVEEAAEEAKGYLAELNEINWQALSHDGSMTAKIFKRHMKLLVEAPKYYWHDFEAVPYKSGSLLNSTLASALAVAPLASSSDVVEYIALLADAFRYVDGNLEKLKGQEQRGILLPKAAIPRALSAYEGFRIALPEMAKVSDERTADLSAADKSKLLNSIQTTLDDVVYPSVDRFTSYLRSDAYAQKAPTAVGLAQYPGGKEAYQHAIQQYATVDWSAEEIHEYAIKKLAAIHAEMKQIRDAAGFEGSLQEYNETLKEDPYYYAKTPQEVEDRYMGYIERIEPYIDDYFSFKPKADYGVKRLNPALEPSQTFGFYQPQSDGVPTGYYLYNGSKLDERPLVFAGPLIYHELIPGHHFQIAIQLEMEGLSDYRAKAVLPSAFAEGWGNYAASLANEMELFEDPRDRYGWLLFDSFITVRLILDTGMNYYGWSLQRARDFMLENTFSAQEEVNTETLRYSVDWPGQALAYKIGFEEIWRARRYMEEKYGDEFDIKRFHAAVIGAGAMPLSVMHEHIEWYMENGDR